MNSKLDIKIRALKGKKYLPYFKSILDSTKIKYYNNIPLSLEKGDEILSRKYIINKDILVPIDKYSGFDYIASLNRHISNSSYCYLFCDYFDLVGPYITETKEIFDNLITIIEKMNDRTIIIVDYLAKFNCLINLLEIENIIDIKLYYN